MLILSRKIDEEIKIGTDITIKILSVTDGQVKIGISAPTSIQIHRGEVYEKVIQNTIEATKAGAEGTPDISKFKINKASKNG
ncbi:MAG: carbon storage regulator CsrA [Ignavibacteriaceae bacterium]|jgi:carbon storage regulator|nr:carbon storage regulator CsrA [Ignavibacteriaceae bacterium]